MIITPRIPCEEDERTEEPEDPLEEDEENEEEVSLLSSSLLE